VRTPPQSDARSHPAEAVAPPDRPCHKRPAHLQVYATELEEALGQLWLTEILGAAPGQIEALVNGRRAAGWLEERIELLAPMLGRDWPPEAA